MTNYIKFKGVDGPVTTEGFEKHIEVSDLHFGVAREIGTAARTNLNREHSEPVFHPIVVKKEFCSADPKLFLASVGTLDHEVEIKCTTTAAGKVDTFAIVKLKNVGIGDYHVTSRPDGKLETTFTMHYDEIDITHTGHGPDVTGSPQTVGYNLKTMKTK